MYRAAVLDHRECRRIGERLGSSEIDGTPLLVWAVLTAEDNRFYLQPSNPEIRGRVLRFLPGIWAGHRAVTHLLRAFVGESDQSRLGRSLLEDPVR
jgi:hypothetical protein